MGSRLKIKSREINTKLGGVGWVGTVEMGWIILQGISVAMGYAE